MTTQKRRSESMRASTVAITGPASGSTAENYQRFWGLIAAGRSTEDAAIRRRSVARRGWPVVPEGGRHATVTFFAVFEAPVGPLSIVLPSAKRSPSCVFKDRESARLPASLGGPLRRSPRAAPERRDA